MIMGIILFVATLAINLYETAFAADNIIGALNDKDYTLNKLGKKRMKS
jgi:hypothetical protein